MWEVTPGFRHDSQSALGENLRTAVDLESQPQEVHRGTALAGSQESFTTPNIIGRLRHIDWSLACSQRDRAEESVHRTRGGCSLQRFREVSQEVTQASLALADARC